MAVENLLLLESWKNIQEFFDKEAKTLHLNELFKNDPHRFKNYSLSINDLEANVSLFIDYSKNLINEKLMRLLFDLAKECQVEKARDDMWSGAFINFTENRQVLHVALRQPMNIPFMLPNGDNLTPKIEKELLKMKRLTEMLHKDEWLGYSGHPITDIVNIGIGGSDLGPRMICHALELFSKKNEKRHVPLNVHFVSNIDGFDLAKTLKKCKRESTLFVIVSKTFTTLETMTNASSAKQWFLKGVNNNVAMMKNHFVAVSTNDSAIVDFGIYNDDAHVFKIWDWVGGRYSLWSSVGLCICIYLGYENYMKLLHGAYVMDCHFRSSPLEKNGPIILALIGIWYNNFFKSETSSILPYEESLSLFAKYLQQTDMESNGKTASKSNHFVNYSTGPIIWGEAGTNGQHAFYQLIHQGTKLIPCDFIGGLNPNYGENPHEEEEIINMKMHHNLLIANCIAQTEALMKGNLNHFTKEEHESSLIKKIDTLSLHRLFAGNKPTTTMLYDRMNPYNLGALIALYEHKVFVQGVIWNINSFDQWGVELGKQLANVIYDEIKNGKIANAHHHDSSTKGLLEHVITKKN